MSRLNGAPRLGIRHFKVREAKASDNARMANRRRRGQAATFLLACGRGKAFRMVHLIRTYFLWKIFEVMIPHVRFYRCYGERIFRPLEIVGIDFSRGWER
jgi:hypothetical protein